MVSMKRTRLGCNLTVTMTPEQLRRQLEYFRDLGFEFLYRRNTILQEKPAAEEHTPTETLGDNGNADEPRDQHTRPLTAPSQLRSSSAIALPGLAPADDSLSVIRRDLKDCRRCRLCEQRKTIVFGSGNEAAKLVFVGEGPGADEDEQGLPFVGRAGQLLTQMIDKTAQREGIPIRREDVYICNVVKCRPPENRTPLPDEMETCGQFLYRQLMTIKPRAVCALGSTAMRALLNSKQGITRMRGEWQKWNNIPLMVTYHPSYLLRQYNQEARREAWEDLKKLLHYVYD
jgi:uracil-DNA glycosylase family 4